MITIYGTTQCHFCSKAVQLAKQWKLKHEYKNIEYKQFRDELMSKKPDVTQVPAIWWNDVYIGNYLDLADEIYSHVDEKGNWKA